MRCENANTRSYSSVTGSQNSEISKIVDKSFDDAYNDTLAAGDLPHVRWGRIDYMAVTYLTTKWAVWTYVSPPLSLSLALSHAHAHAPR